MSAPWPEGPEQAARRQPGQPDPAQPATGPTHTGSGEWPAPQSGVPYERPWPPPPEPQTAGSTAPAQQDQTWPPGVPQPAQPWAVAPPVPPETSQPYASSSQTWPPGAILPAAGAPGIAQPGVAPPGQPPTPWAPAQAAPWQQPSAVPPPARPRRSRKKLIWSLVAGFTALVVLCCGGGIGAYVYYKDRWLTLDGLDGPSSALELLQEIQLPAQADAGGATSDGRTLYYAYTAPGTGATVVAKPLEGGGKGWTKTVGDFPDDSRLTVIEDILLVEFAYGGGGGDARVVLSTKDGSTLSEDRWGPNDLDAIALVGTDLIYAKAENRKSSVERVDLRTGTTKWSYPLPGTGLSIGRQATVGYLWPNGQKPAAQPFDGFGDYLADAGERFRTSAGADIGTIVADDDSGTTHVIDGNTGQAKVTAPTKPKFAQVVLAGVLVVYSPERGGGGFVTGYDVTTLREKWQTPLPEADGIARPQPCAPTIVCIDAGAATQGLVVPVNVETGKALPDLRTMPPPPGDPLTFSPSDWTVLDKRVIGTSITQTGVAESVDPWKVTQAHRDGLSVKSYAAGGRYTILEEADDPGWPGGKYGYHLFALNVETLEYTEPVWTGDNLPQDVDVFGDVFCVVTGDKRVLALRI